MKVKVIAKFKDKYSGDIHEPDEVLELEGKRVAEILKAGKFVEKLKEDKDE